MGTAENDSTFLIRRTISLSGARRVIAAAHEEAARHGWDISVAVVDAGGELVALEKADRAIPISPTVAFNKARTAALLQMPSKEFEDFINQGQVSFLATPGATPLEGGVPLIANETVIGAVGISGAHGPNDSQVAVFAASALND